MSFLMITGAGGVGAIFDQLASRVRAAGHEAVAPDLPTGAGRGLHEYAAAMVDAASDLTDITVVAMSMGGFTAALVAERLPVTRLVFVNAMIPVSGETAGEWGDDVGYPDAKAAVDRAGGRDPDAEFDPTWSFYNEIDPRAQAEFETHQLPPDSSEAFTTPARFQWPDVPKIVLVAEQDHLLPAEFQRRVSAERLGVDAITIPGGHMALLSHADEIAAHLL